MTAYLTTRYSFTEGRLQELSTGVSAQYARGKPRAAIVIANVQELPPSTPTTTFS